MRTIVTVGTDAKFAAGMERLQSMLPLREKVLMHYDVPAGSLPDPFAFKIAAIENALNLGANPILWCDSSVVPLRKLDPLWDLIESQGYWFSKNYDYTQGEFCSDRMLELGGMTREEAFKVPHAVASCFGLNFSSLWAGLFLRDWKLLASVGAFQDGGSSDPRFRGHRHDQSAASHVIHAWGLKLTEPPDYFCEEGMPSNSKTILTLKRPR